MRVPDPLGVWPRVSRLGASAAGAAGRAGLGAVDRIASSDWAGDAAAIVVRSPLVPRVADELLRSGVIDQIGRRLATGPELDRMLTGVLDSEALTRLIDRTLESSVVDASVARILASEELWIVVEEIAQSPAVTDAIAHQGVGFVDQVAGELGERSRSVDDRLERGARKFFRRRAPAGST
jgi:hypothetical protein